MGMAYDPSNVDLSQVIYRVNEAGDPPFIPAYPIMDEGAGADR